MKKPRPIPAAATAAPRAVKRGSVLAKGNLSPRDYEGSEVVFSVQGDSATIVRRGLYAQLEAGRPNKGARISYGGAILNVVATRLRRDRGTLGTLTIELGAVDDVADDPQQETLELDFTICERPLDRHPLYADIFQPEDDDFADMLAIRAWEMETDPAKKFQFKYLTASSTYGTLSSGAQAYAKKLLAGIEAYFVQVPVVRKTSQLARAVTSSNAGQREAPPEFAVVASAWLKTADKILRRGAKGAWERVEEWTGFDSLDSDIYPEGE